MQNADADKPEIADVRETPAACRLHLPPGTWHIRWYDPRNGAWHESPERHEIAGGFTRDFQAPFPGDAVLLLTQP